MPQIDEPDGLIWRIADRAIGAMARNSFASRHGRVPAAPVEHRPQVRVRASAEVAEGVRAVELERLDAQPLPPWQPGSHIDVFLPAAGVGVDTAAGWVQRQYSLCGDPTDQTGYRVAVRAIPGGSGSAAMHGLRVGDRLEVGRPRNAFPFLIAPQYSFIAGGIGITPILSMIRAAQRRGAAWSLLYLGRSERSMPFLDELRGLDELRRRAANGSAGQTGGLHVRPDEIDGPAATDELLRAVIPGAPLYCCGPPSLIAGLRDAGQLPGVASVHSERFSPAPVQGGGAFEIELARTHEITLVGPHETALTALRRLRPDLAYSCQQGFCGTCRLHLLDGDVDHRDQALTPAERNNTVMPCVSRAKGRIVVDL